MIAANVKTLASVVGRISYKVKGLAGVLWVLPDSYLDVKEEAISPLRKSQFDKCYDGPRSEFYCFSWAWNSITKFPSPPPPKAEPRRPLRRRPLHDFANFDYYLDEEEEEEQERREKEAEAEVPSQIVSWGNHLKVPEEAKLSPEAKDLISRLLCNVEHRLGTKGVHEIMLNRAQLKLVKNIKHSGDGVSS
ncbi:hypothetical protein Cni_G22457 [Canna indica]|uniref:Uncharacterized protein n=1 Tax=Canna indica TaxID=4628 RepID=A0AAQ3KSH8_9LILI|nr:hypothetical protein Cni_G22457 [Canna indica]